MDIKGRPLLFYAPINYSGYGQASVNILNELDYQGCEASLDIISEKNCEPHFDELVKRCKKRMDNYDPKWPTLKIFHERNVGERYGNGLYCAMMFPEIDKFSQYVKNQLKTADKLIVASDWGKQVLEENGFNNSYVAPLGVDRSIFNEFVEPMIPENGKTRYFVIGKYEIRKSFDIILECFNKAFDQSDNVELYVKAHHPLRDKRVMTELNESWKTSFKTSKLGNKIHIFDKFDTQNQLAGFMASADCGLTISRAEAWNLENLEFLALGKHVITTYNTGHTQYCTNNNSLLVELTEKEDPYDGVYFHGKAGGLDGQWPTFTQKDKDLVVDYMRHIHKLKQEGNLRRNQYGIETAKQFSWTNTVNKLSKIIWG